MPSASAWFRSVTSHAGAAANDRSSCTCTARSRCSLPGRSWRSSKYRVGGSATRARTRESTFSSSGSTSGDHDGGGDSIATPRPLVAPGRPDAPRRREAPILRDWFATCLLTAKPKVTCGSPDQG